MHPNTAFSFSRRSRFIIAVVMTSACAHQNNIGVRSAREQTRISTGSSTDWSNPTSQAPEALIYRMWESYLASKGGQYATHAGTPSPLWRASEQTQWPMYDLAGFYIPDDAVPEVLSIRPSRGERGAEYEIVTRFSPRVRGDSAASMTYPTITVLAVQDSGQWRLANVLPARTRAWRREVVGPITYFVSPELTFNEPKARRTAAFVDSLADAFNVPRLTRLDYYVTTSVDQALHILGVDLFVKYGPHGGFAKPVNHQLFSGIPELGEEYRHELTHLVLMPTYLGGAVGLFASEGIATWFGGTSGLDYRAAVRELDRYLGDHPSITLDSAMVFTSAPQNARYSAAAVLCAMLNDAGGVAAVKEFLVADARPEALRSTVTRILGKPWPAVLADWRSAVRRIASS